MSWTPRTRLASLDEDDDDDDIFFGASLTEGQKKKFAASSIWWWWRNLKRKRMSKNELSVTKPLSSFSGTKLFSIEANAAKVLEACLKRRLVFVWQEKRVKLCRFVAACFKKRREEKKLRREDARSIITAFIVRKHALKRLSLVRQSSIHLGACCKRALIPRRQYCTLAMRLQITSKMAKVISHLCSLFSADCQCNRTQRCLQKSEAKHQDRATKGPLSDIIGPKSKKSLQTDQKTPDFYHDIALETRKSADCSKDEQSVSNEDTSETPKMTALTSNTCPSSTSRTGTATSSTANSSSSCVPHLPNSVAGITFSRSFTPVADCDITSSIPTFVPMNPIEFPPTPPTPVTFDLKE